MTEDQYERDSECEDYQDYGPDGYHPVVLGERFNGQYIVRQKLGWGHFSTVWLAHNQLTGKYVALKIQKSKEDYCSSAVDQLQMLQEIRKHENDQPWVIFREEMSNNHPNLISEKLCHPLSLLDNFVHHGIHGKHYCSVFQLMGPNLLDLIQHFEFKEKRMPMWLVKKITIDVLMGLVHLHDFSNIIHTDLKPQNIMMKLHPEEELQLIQRVKEYSVKPLSMKYLKNIQASKNSKNKNKKKYEKKKLKKNQQKAQTKPQENNQDDNIQDKQESELVSNSQQSDSQQHSSLQPSNLMEHQSNGSKQAKISTKQLLKNEQKNSEENNKKVSQSDMSILKWKNMNIKLNTDVFFKIADMGNACFTNKHFTDNIQTREYRSPEVLIGHEYYPNTDIWSLACIVFEMLTNNFLFKPKRLEGIPKDEDHMFKIIEVLGPVPKEFAIEGTESSSLFNKKAQLLHGNPKEHLPIRVLLHQDFSFDKEEAQQIEKFLLPMLEYQPKKRISAKDCLKHEWLWK